jgi:hypothetical protein
MVAPGIGTLLGGYLGHKIQSRKPGEKAGLGERAARVAINPVGYVAGKAIGAPATVASKISGGLAGQRKGIAPSMLRGASKVWGLASSAGEPGSESMYQAFSGLKK